jgi:hypothetical protein
MSGDLGPPGDRRLGTLPRAARHQLVAGVEAILVVRDLVVEH